MARDIDESARLLVIERARRRCKYCLVHEDNAGFPHQIDHIISRKHGGSSGIGNLAYACILCNRYKGTDIASIDRSGRSDPAVRSQAGPMGRALQARRADHPTPNTDWGGDRPYAASQRSRACN